MNRLLAIFLLLAATVSTKAETIDRVVLVVSRHPITELQLEEEIRIIALLNEEPLSTDAAERSKAAERLVDQALVQREMRLTHFPLPTDDDIDSAFSQLEDEQGGKDRFARTLDRYQLTASEVRQHLALQIATLRFIAFRFRPEFGIQENAVKQAYDEERAKWIAEHPGQPVPTFAASRPSLRHQLLEQQTDSAVTEWLQQERKQVRIDYIDSTLEPKTK